MESENKAINKNILHLYSPGVKIFPFSAAHTAGVEETSFYFMTRNLTLTYSNFQETFMTKEYMIENLHETLISLNNTFAF